MLWHELVFIVGFVGVRAELDGRSRVVHIDQGPVRGRQDADSGVFIFSNIPYATAPVGSQRFQAPLPPPTWNEPIGEDRRIICPQCAYLKGRVMQDDCLIANIYVPDTDLSNLPVIVYIHGGGFQIGSGDMISPVNFIRDKHLIAVTFNYRLGINGFLCLGTKNAAGNAGLKDQIALLRWVKKNIASFGGNPDDVTIAGYSSGSVAVDLLMISKAAVGLFNKVIPESGASTGIIAMQIDPIHTAKNYAISLGFPGDNDDVYELEKFLKSIPVDVFYKKAKIFENYNSTMDFVACVERDAGEEVVIHDAPVNIIKNGDYRKVPMLYGFAEMEGYIHIERFPIWKPKLNEKFSEFLPGDLQFDSLEEKDKVASAVKKFYYGDKDLTEESILPFIDYFSDVMFGYSTLRAAKLHVESGHDQIYLYEFSFVDDEIPFVPNTTVKGANHCAQSLTVLDLRKSLTGANDTEEYIKIRDVVQNMWFNFIMTGKPVPEGSPLPAWPALSLDASPYMSLGVEVQLKENLIEDRFRLWDNIYSRHYRPPQAPLTPLLYLKSEL